ncbi:MAG: glucosamine inositolphosphorylceramide transferase family protein [Opitutaceae bacterium]
MNHPNLAHRSLALSIALVIGACGYLSQVLAAESAKKNPVGKAGAQNVWTLGIYTGPSPFELSPPAGVKNPVLTPNAVTDLGVEANILAHPFMVIKNSRYFLFFTVKSDTIHTGNIGLAESSNGLDWKYRQIVLREPFILAYPCVVEWRGDYYMIPETATEPSIRLYRAADFPTNWEYIVDLVSGESYRSASLVHYKDMWWMYTSRPGNETLRLYFARELKGPWTEHPLSPVVARNLKTARPGGRPLVIDGKLYRMGQDYSPVSGRQVYAYQVTEISTTIYQEKQLEPPVVKATAKGWNAQTMHHVDARQIGPSKWIAAVDGLGR